MPRPSFRPLATIKSTLKKKHAEVSPALIYQAMRSAPKACQISHRNTPQPKPPPPTASSLLPI
ncbi:hypothetical protein BU23DRAFT_128043 [Bimuria novae-zelandiae CBS 107.79]|uniref:Uncharacterized protein n=1 Tax=Bimuria novae-zelandiae CBS 107.79 TaxID=1447943 RepID=A0A6A5VA10_9PLEO|nr:hypothetical protein BU23DRAFT_128043 [Bimuria novae-zelandiae CBS 107.79]